MRALLSLPTLRSVRFIEVKAESDMISGTNGAGPAPVRYVKNYNVYQNSIYSTMIFYLFWEQYVVGHQI